MAVTREQFLSADDSDTEIVDVPKIGNVRVRSITGEQTDRWVEYVKTFNDGKQKPHGWQ